MIDVLTCPAPPAEGRHVLLAHGGGGRLMRRLVERLIVPPLANAALAPLADGAVLDPIPGRLAFTTDGFVVQPLFFPGGDIGCLAVHGTVNDLAMCGARPLFVSLGFIVEEGLPLEDLERVVASVARAARQAGVIVVTGDTKVVERGKGDGLFVHTSGIGAVRVAEPFGPRAVEPDDAVIVSGPIGQHGIAVLGAREGLAFSRPVTSDCASVAGAVHALLDAGIRVRCLRDPTRGGVATTLNEIALQADLEIALDEPAIPVSAEVAGACEVLGLDPLYVACEGRFLAVVDPAHAAAAVALLRSRADAAGAAVIGAVRRTGPNGPLVTARSALGGVRVLDLPAGEQLPRIC
jgi:hydrogenase expression/formation protein HypE